MDEKWLFYILRCSDRSLYCGITNDIEERLRKHNAGNGAKYTLVRRPVVLVYSGRHENISEARRREEQVKRWSRAKKEQLVIGIVPKGLP